MRLAAHSSTLLNLPFEDGLALVEDLGIADLELAAGGYFQNFTYGDPRVLVDDAEARARWSDSLERHGISVCAFSVHGEPLSPDPAVAGQYREDLHAIFRLAEVLGVERVALLAGLPEGAEGEHLPYWVVDLPAEFAPRDPGIIEWQWEHRVIPYWREQASLADAHGCKLCFEFAAWDVVYNPRTMLRLRDALGAVAGCNFDPSHLFYVGVDVCEAARALRDAIYLVHAKDTRFLKHNVRVNGWLDVNPRISVPDRSWIFASPGFGHDAHLWSEFVTTLRLVGYDDVLSIEHEDDVMGLTEGLKKAAAFLAPIVLEEPPLPSFAAMAES